MRLWERIAKREPQRVDADWKQRTYPCHRWYCFRRSPAWRSFERRGESWCDRHIPGRKIEETVDA